MRTATLSINQTALTHNLHQVKQIAPNAKVLAMVKANAYGHGVSHALPALQDADSLGVACFEEAAEIRSLGWKKPIVLIEGVFSEAEWNASIDANCQSVIHQQQQADWAINNVPKINLSTTHSATIKSAEPNPSRTVWLKLNTGMNRLGFEPDDILTVAQSLHRAGYRLILTSHFANADNFEHPLNQQQITLFNHTLTQLRLKIESTIKASLCNSAGIINFPNCHLDWVRPGIMLYGSSPCEDKTARYLNLQAAMTLQAKLMAIHDIPQGASIGYGSQFIADHPMRKGIVSIGYGDGYPRVIDEAAWVSLLCEGKMYKCSILGRVAMDMIAIDLTQVPNAKLDNRVTLWGDAQYGMPSIDDIAAAANTIGYELMCRVTKRPTRASVL